MAEPSLSRPGSRRASLSFLFVLLFTVAIYARPEDVVPAIAQFHLTFALGLCAGLTYLVEYLSGNAPFVWKKQVRIVLLFTCWVIVGVQFVYRRGGSFRDLLV